MPEWLSQLSAFSVFLAIGGIGFTFMLLSLVFGELFEHGFDVDHGFDADLGHGGPGLLSSRVLCMFVTAFGGIGAIATNYGLTPLPASGAGTVGGVVFAGIVYGFLRFLWSRQASSITQTNDLAGITARVVVAIPAGGVGQVRCRVGEDLLDKIARSKTGEAVAENTVVHVDEVLGEIVIVSKAERAGAAASEQ